MWEFCNVVRCVFCWKQGIPKDAGAHGLRHDGFEQRAFYGDDLAGPYWYCPKHAAMIDRHYATDARLINGAGI